MRVSKSYVMQVTFLGEVRTQKFEEFRKFAHKHIKNTTSATDFCMIMHGNDAPCH